MTFPIYFCLDLTIQDFCAFFTKQLQIYSVLCKTTNFSVFFWCFFQGIWIPVGQSQVQVAVKVLQKSSGEQSKEFLDEARIMCSVDHPCCVRILGICLSARMMLVTQLMPLGCLLEFIRRNTDRVGSAMLLNWCKQIAEAGLFLEIFFNYGVYVFQLTYCSIWLDW